METLYFLPYLRKGFEMMDHDEANLEQRIALAEEDIARYEDCPSCGGLF